MNLRQRIASLSNVSVLGSMAVTVIIISVIWAIALERVNHERENSIAAEIQKNSNLAHSHQERAARSFEVLDQVLLFLRAEYLAYGPPKSLKIRLGEIHADNKNIGVMSLIGPKGQLLATTGDTMLPNYADREYFKVHAADATDRLLIGKPIIGRVTGKWIITLTRRITLPDGSFGGVVVLSLDPLYFATDYAKTNQGRHGAMALIGLDGITRARRNGDKISFGEDVSASQLFKELPKAVDGHYIGVAASDGHRRIVAYRSLENYPMVTIVGSSLEDVLALSRGREKVYLSAAALSTLLVITLAATFIITSIRRFKTLATIADSERRYRLLFENSLDAVISTQPDGRISAANPAACLMFGRDADELQQIYRNQLFEPQDHRYTVLLAQEESTGVMQGPVTMLRSDGCTFEAEVSASNYPDGTQLSSMIIRDVTERKLAEVALRASEARRKLATDSGRVAIWEVDLKTNNLIWDENCFTLYQIRKEDFTGTFEEWSRTIHPQDLDSAVLAFQAAVAGTTEFDLTFRIVWPNGEVRHIEAHGEVSRNGDGTPERMIGTNWDITGIKNQQEKLAQIAQFETMAKRRIEAANMELKRSNDDLQQFAYVASHDLQEPLRSVSSSVQLLKRRYAGALDARADEFIEHAVGGVTRMQALIEDLLTYSRVASGPRLFSSVDLEAELKVVLDNLGSSLAANMATVTHDPLPTLQANPLQIRQILQNLIGNALKFRGDKPAVVHIGAVRCDTEWQFSVADQGIGIAPEYFERVFKLFQRLHTRTEYEGTGIGLTICHKIVERHGGSIWVESAPGQGSKFFFTLPFEIEAAAV